MLSLIVALESMALTGGSLRFALSRDATPGVHTAADLNADGLLVDQGSAPLALLARSDELVAVVPAARLSWHQASLPKIGIARLRSALDGVLEERVLDDPSSLHFALAPDATAGRSVWIATCDKAWLQSALQMFEAAGRPVSRVVPEYTPLSSDDVPVWHAIGVPESAWLVRCADDGVQLLPLVSASCEALGLIHNAQTGRSAQITNDATGDVTTEPSRPVCFADPAIAGLAEQWLGLGVRIDVLHGAQRLVLASRSNWDLAQFDLASTGRTRFVRRAGLAWAQWMGSAAWRPARWALVVLLLTQLFGLNFAAMQERAALQAKRKEVSQLLTQTFPKVPLVVNAPVQMERELTLMRQATGAMSKRDLESMLALVAANLKTAPQLTGIDFATGELTLKGFQLPAADAGTLQATLTSAGYSHQIDGNLWRIQAQTPSSVAKPDAGVSP